MQEQLALAFRIASINFQRDSIAQVEINGDKLSTKVGDFEYARPSSNHPGTVVAAMLDGSTKSIDEKIEYHVYQALMTPQTRQSDVPYHLYLLKEDDYLL